jgi:hypothetical protein
VPRSDRRKSGRSRTFSRLSFWFVALKTTALAHLIITGDGLFRGSSPACPTCAAQQGRGRGGSVQTPNEKGDPTGRLLIVTLLRLVVVILDRSVKVIELLERWATCLFY